MVRNLDILRGTRLERLLQRFARDRSGAIAMFFGLIVVPLLLVVGMSIDYGHATTYQTSMQRVLDEAVIAGATTLAKTNDAARAEAAARRRFEATRPSAYPITLNVAADRRTGNVTADAEARVPMSFMTLSGHQFLDVSAHAKAASKRAAPAAQVASRASAGPARMPAAPKISPSQMRDLIDRVERVCYQLRAAGFAGRVPQCRAVFDGSFANRLRARIAANGDAKSLLPSGVRLVQ